jgi:L-ascorbate metabolism protein UlaG (beta-lactamase superfamily)
MLIQYYGDFCFKITTKPGGRATEDIVIWTDPLKKGAGLRSPQGAPHVLLASHEDPKSPLETKEETILLNMPGEYSTQGIGFQAYPSFRDNENGATRGQNTFFAFESEDLHIVYLGALGHELSPEVLDKLSHTDILFLPIGGGDTLSVPLAVELIKKIEPSIVIPMHFALNGLTIPSLGDKRAFCEALSVSSSEAQSKLILKKKDLEGKNMEVIFLERGA